MKFGPRKPNFKKRIKARTTGKLKRKVKKSVNPLYGKKGMGWINDPKRAAYNKVYQKTTFDAVPSFSGQSHATNENFSGIGCLAIGLVVTSFLIPPLFVISIPFTVYSYKKQQSVTKKNTYNQQLLSELAVLEDQIQKNQKIKGIEPFFERMSEIHQTKIEVTQTLKTGHKKEYITIEKKNEIQAEVQRVYHLLLADYIERYEEAAFEEAMKLKTETGRKNNYQRAYDDLLAYQAYFSPELVEHLNKKWRKMK